MQWGITLLSLEQYALQTVLEVESCALSNLRILSYSAASEQLIIRIWKLIQQIFKIEQLVYTKLLFSKKWTNNFRFLFYGDTDFYLSSWDMGGLISYYCAAEDYTVLSKISMLLRVDKLRTRKKISPMIYLFVSPQLHGKN